MMTIDRVFKKRLRDISKYLLVKFNLDIQRWEIFYRNPDTQEVFWIMRVENEDGSYRPIDMRTIQHLKAIDCQARGITGTGIWNDMQDYKERLAKRQWDAMREKKMATTDGMRPYVRQVINNAQRGIF